MMILDDFWRDVMMNDTKSCMLLDIGDVDDALMRGSPSKWVKECDYTCVTTNDDR